MRRSLNILGSLLLYAAIFSADLKAQEASSGLDNIVFALPELDSDPGRPGRRGDGASRGDCDLADVGLTALVPEEIETREPFPGAVVPMMTHVWGQTLSERPTFWFEVSKIEPEMTFEFRLSDEAGQLAYGDIVPLPEEAGTFSVVLPRNVPSLEMDAFYYWSAVLERPCLNGENQRLSIDGWVQRVIPEAALADQLATATTEEAVLLYAESGIWFDALTVLGKLYQDNPEDAIVQAAWIRLMESVDLSGTEPPLSDH